MLIKEIKMNIKIRPIIVMCFLFSMWFLLTSTVEARDLVDAAQSAQSMFNRIGIAAISIGFTLGGILFAVGAAQVGRMLLISGAIGAVAVLAAPAVINLLGRVFGASL